MRSRTPRDRFRSSAGFALFALMIALAVTAMAASVMVLFAARVIDADRVGSVTDEIQEVYRAIVGDQRDTFGYVGEVGTYPVSLIDLARDPGNAGWRGPYLRDPRVANDMLLDPWGQPYEYFVVDGVATSDQLAIISRGPDGLSTNTAADPNVRTNFTGIAPTDAAYFSSDPRNADNIVFPLPLAGYDALNVNTDSILSVALNNFDSNSQVDEFVPACPNLFTITVTNTSRGTDDVPATPYSPGFQVTLPQGSYRVLVSSALLPTPPVNDRIVVFPVVPVTKTYNVTGVDSSGTDLFTLTVDNQYPVDNVTIAQFGNNLGAVSPNEVRTFTPKACSTINVKISGDVVESFTMPHSNFAVTVGGTAAAVTVDNNLNKTVQVYKDGLFIGDVKKNKTKTFSEGLVEGNVITVTRADTGALVGGPLTLVPGTQTLVVP